MHSQGQALRVLSKISTLVPRVVFFQKTLTFPSLENKKAFIGFIYRPFFLKSEGKCRRT